MANENSNANFQGSYIVIDNGGMLYDELATQLGKRGYDVDCVEFLSADSTLRYDPLDHVRFQYGRPVVQDINDIARAFCHGVRGAASNYLASYIAYVLETQPREMQSSGVLIDLFGSAGRDEVDELFAELERENPGSYAVELYGKASEIAVDSSMHACIINCVAGCLREFDFAEARACFGGVSEVNFRRFGHEKRVLFVSLQRAGMSLKPSMMTELLIKQAQVELRDERDCFCEDGRLPVQVRFIDGESFCSELCA